MAGAALALAAIAVVLSAWNLVRRPEAPAPPAAPSGSTAVSARDAASPGNGVRQPARSEEPARLQELQRRVEALEREDARRAGDDARDVPERDAGERKRYTSFVSPERSVEVKQDENGAVFAINRDPALTGEILLVEARRDDGSVETMSIVVPPPE
jgi:hypothetical protein